jgi:predicted dehydrogenase (TIGR03970 family)
VQYRPAEAADPDLTVTLSPSSHTQVLIVGAGSSGSVLAERLSADPERSVRLIEAGPGPDTTGVATLIENARVLPIGDGSPVVSSYQTTLTEHPVRTMRIVRGATLGGSGGVNGGYFCRGLPQDFDGWKLPGWTWAEVAKHFRAIETDLDFPHSPAHGDSGPVEVSRTQEFVGVTAAFVDATKRAGFTWLADLNDGGTTGLPTGVGAVPLNIVDGRRRGAGAAFLLPALSRPNLCVLTGTRAIRIRFAGGRAVGVDAIGPTGPVTLTADRIVLSGGAIGSAHLLMLSGVGPEPALRRLGIGVIVPAPVGLSCADHPEWVLPVDWAVAPSRPVLETVASLNGVEIRAYTAGFNAMVGNPVGDRPDLPHIGVALMTPRTRGRVSLVSADPEVPPRIEHRYDSEPDDIAALAEGAAVARELAAAAAEVGEPVWSTSQHLCATAPMGADTDPGAVLDARCRVRGVEGLWVIDGSILPTIPSRGPHATTVMLGHRAAEFVRAG